MKQIKISIYMEGINIIVRLQYYAPYYSNCFNTEHIDSRFYFAIFYAYLKGLHDAKNLNKLNIYKAGFFLTYSNPICEFVI